MRERLAELPVVSSGLSLMTGTMVTSALGLLFWVLAANLYDTSDFGVSTTAVYTMMMLADVACLGLRTGLVRYLPNAGGATRRTILWGYGIVLLASVLTALIFLAGMALWAPDLAALRNTVLIGIFFTASTAFWALFMLEDAVLVGLRRAPWVPVENTLFGICKIVLLVPFASISPTLGIFWAWTVPVFPIVIGINVLIARLPATRKTRVQPDELPAVQTLLRRIMAFSLADWLASLARLAALGVIPLMVLAKTDQDQAGYFQASWLIAFTVMALSSNAAYALLAETSYEQAKLHKNSVHAGMLSLALTIPVVVIGLVGAPYLLLIYGSDFADNSSSVLRLLLLATLPNIMHQIYVGRLRAQGRMGGVIFFETLLSVIVVSLSWFLLPRYGIDGVGYAWLGGLALLGLYAALSESLWLWAAHVDTKVVRRVGLGIRRVQSGRPARGMQTRMDKALAIIGQSPTWVRWLPAGDHAQSALVETVDNENIEVVFARSSDGAEDLAARRNVITGLWGDPMLNDIRPLLPELRTFGTDSSQEFSAYSYTPGTTACDLLREDAAEDQVCEAVLESIRPLHDATRRTVVVDQEMLDHWTEDSYAYLANQGRASATKLGRLSHILADSFLGATIEVGQIQGALAPDNTVVDPETLEVTGLWFWEWGRQMPLAVDAATFVLSCLSIDGDLELGEVVRRLLIDPARFEQHPALAGLPESTVSSRGLILLTWLHLVGHSPRRTMSPHVFWLARNAQPVLASLHSPAGSNQ